MNPRINVRNLPSPQRWGSAQAGMSWHHIIPFSLLREVWNRLVDVHIATQLSEARVAIRQYLLLSDASLLKLDELIDRMRAENASQQRTRHHQLPSLDVADANRLATAATWPAWNTVEGPSRRSDDPHDSYLDRFTAGLTVQELGRMRAIESLLPQLQRFVSAGSMPGALHLRELAGAISLTRPNVYCDSPIRYRPNMWVKDQGDFWRKARG